MGVKTVVVAAVVVFFFFFFLRGGNRCLPQHRKDGLSLITITTVGMGNLKLEQTMVHEIDYP